MISTALFHHAFWLRSLLALILLAPITAMMGVQVVNTKKAFFVDAVSHSSFAGVAVGLLLGISPLLSMPAVALAIALLMVYLERKSRLSVDSVVGVIFSGVVAFGLAVVSRSPAVKRDMVRFLYGDILTITDGELVLLALLALVLLIFQFFSFNALVTVGLNATLAKAHRIRVRRFQYLQSALLAWVVIFSVRWVGVFLVTGLLIIPAATARNGAKSVGQMFRLAVLVSLLSVLLGLILSLFLDMATGPTIVLVALGFFLLSIMFSRFESRRQRSRLA